MKIVKKKESKVELRGAIWGRGNKRNLEGHHTVFFFCVYLSSLTCSLIAKRSSILIGIEVAIVTSL